VLVEGHVVTLPLNRLLICSKLILHKFMKWQKLLNIIILFNKHKVIDRVIYLEIFVWINLGEFLYFV